MDDRARRDNRLLKNGLIVFLLWLVVAGIDRIWLWLDQSLPNAAQAEHLNYLWNHSTTLGEVVPPLFYAWGTIADSILRYKMWPTADQACWMYLLFSGILLVSVYGLGSLLVRPWSAIEGRSLGLWAAGFCAFLPGLWPGRLQFGLAYPIVAMVTLSFWLLSLWWMDEESEFLGLLPPDETASIEASYQWVGENSARTELRLLQATIYDLPKHPIDRQTRNRFRWSGGWRFPRSVREWGRVVALGLAIGLAALTSPICLGFLIGPIGLSGLFVLIRRRWRRCLEWLTGMGIASAIAQPWYRAHAMPLLIQLGDSLTRSVNFGVILQIPQQISYPLFLVGIFGLIRHRKRVADFQQLEAQYPHLSVRVLRRQVYRLFWARCSWLLFFLASGYGFCGLGLKLDLMPVLPVGAILLTQGLLLFRSWLRIRGVVLAVTVVLSLANLFPILLFRSPAFLAKQPENWQQESLLLAMQKAQPNLAGTLGVLSEAAAINAPTFEYVAKLVAQLQDWPIAVTQVDETQANKNSDHISRSLTWYALKTGDTAHPKLTQSIEKSPDLELKQQWKLPDNSDLKLYHRKNPSVVVTPIVGAQWTEEKPLKLEKVSLPAQAPPHQPMPVTYTWAGSLEELRSGLVLLTWKRQTEPNLGNQSVDRWFHDHALGLGQIQLGKADPKSLAQVTETFAMMPPDSAAGTYALEATYLNRLTGDRYPLIPPGDTVTISADAKAESAPELDPVTQLRLVASSFLQGVSFDQVQTKLQQLQQIQPDLDYIQQLEIATTDRLQTESKNVDLYVSIGLTKILQNRPQEAIVLLQNGVTIEPNNGNAQVGLAFASLLNLNLSAAADSLQKATQLQANSPLLKPLQEIVEGLRWGNFVRAWQGYIALSKIA